MTAHPEHHRAASGQQWSNWDEPHQLPAAAPPHPAEPAAEGAALDPDEHTANIANFEVCPFTRRAARGHRGARLQWHHKCTAHQRDGKHQRQEFSNAELELSSPSP